MLEAAVVEVDGDVVSGSGGVSLQVGTDVITGDRFTADLDARTAVVHDGVWVSSEAVVTFERAEIDLRDRSMDGTGVSLTTCDCEGRKPWTVTAKRASVRLDDEVLFRSGWLRIFDVPLVPLPGGVVPLKRRSGLLPPGVSYGIFGLRVAQPLFLTQGRSADATITPELRTVQGVRVLGEQRYAVRGGDGIVEGAYGTDFVEERGRGFVGGQHRLVRDRYRHRLQGTVLTDVGYLRDYQDSVLQRGLLWTEQRALLGLQGVEVGTNGFQDANPVEQQLVNGAVRAPLSELPGEVFADAAVETAIWSTAPDLWTGASEDTELAGVGRLGLERPTRLGAVVFTPRLDGGGRSEGDARIAYGRGSADVRLSAWKGATRVEPIVGVAAATSTGTAPEGQVWAVGDHGVPTAWGVSPGLLFRHSGNGLGEARVSAPVGPDGVALLGDGLLQLGRWSGWLQSQATSDAVELATTGLGWSSRPFQLSGSWLWADYDDAAIGREAVHQARGTVGVRPPGLQQTLLLSASTAYDLEAERFVARVASLRYTHPTGCVDATLSGRLEPDRELPELRFTLGVVR